MNRQTKAIILSLMKDIASKDSQILRDTERILYNSNMLSIFRSAECPENFIQAMRDSVELSYAERRHCSQALIKAFNKHLKAKKSPA
jgi:hypothetical protein